MNHLTIATSSGIIWLALVTHFGAALVALVAGTIALVVVKGGRLHKQSGIVFSWGMIITGLLASVLSAYEGKSIVGGLFVAYLVFTATTTVKPLPRAARGVDVALMLFAFATAGTLLFQGVTVWQLPGHMFAGVPAGMILFLGTICLLAAIGDARMIHEGGLRGTRRLARHLWRMCFGLFVATGSFFIGQMNFIPKPIRVVPLLFALGVAPLFILLYWMWRVRLRRRVSGMIVAREIPAAG
jgi:hypothetical protein